MSFKKICICLILIFCIIGAASAAEDVSMDAVDASADAVAVDAVSDDVSDSVESIDDEVEPVVVGSAPAQDENVGAVSGQSQEILSSSNDDILSMREPSQIIYVNISNNDDTQTDWGMNANDGSSWSSAYGTDNCLADAFIYIDSDDFQSGQIYVADGNYTVAPDYNDLLSNYNKVFNIEGCGDNVVFSFDSVYNLDTGSANYYGKTVGSTITHKKVIFDCDVKVGSKNFKFIDCTFNKGLTLSHDYESDDVLEMTFENCTFANPKSDIAIADKVTASFDDDCTFPITAVDSVVDISSPEKGVVVVTLTDNSTNPIAGATVKYTVNGGEEQTNTTGEDGKFTISGLTGEVTIAVSYEGNESYNAISDTKSFNFTEEPVVPPKVATKITAPKVSAVYNVAKKLVITLTDKDGKALANKKVTVKVGTISKTLTTNAKGQVSLNVATLVPKTYTATVKFAGDDAYLASSVSPKVVVSKAKPQIVAKAKTFKVKTKTKKYTVTLKNNKGKVLKKVKLTLKVGKKTYKATTNSKGKATFKITKLSKKGKYTATVKFAGNKYYKALSKKVKITVKK